MLRPLAPYALLAIALAACTQADADVSPGESAGAHPIGGDAGARVAPSTPAPSTGTSGGASSTGATSGAPSSPSTGSSGGAAIVDGGAASSSASTPSSSGASHPLAKHALIGYWHNFANPSGAAFPIRQVSDDWDVIDVAFATNAQPSGSMAFALDPSLDPGEFKADVAAKRAAGKKVVLSLGGQDGTVSLATDSDVDNFVTSLTAILKTYGFDGLDIDLETGAGITSGAPVQKNLVTAIKRIKANTLGDSFYLSMAPEHPYVQGAYVAYAGIWGSYLPIIEGLRADLTVLHVQLYNDGDMPTPWGTFRPTTEDLLVASVDMLLAGFQPAGASSPFAPLRPDQVAIGLPSGNTAANPGNFASVATIESAFDCLASGTGCATHKPAKTYPALRGVMAWSINWDKHDGPANYSVPLASYLHRQP